MAPHTPLHPDVALNLALAVVVSSTAPLILLNGDLTVVAASRSFCQAFQIDARTAPGLTLAGLGSGEWNVPQINSLLNATAAGFASVENYEIDLCRTGQSSRRLVLNAERLDYGGTEKVQLLLSVADVTDARSVDDVEDAW